MRRGLPPPPRGYGGSGSKNGSLYKQRRYKAAQVIFPGQKMQALDKTKGESTSSLIARVKKLTSPEAMAYKEWLATHFP